MKKHLTILLTILFFQSQAFCQLGLVSFPVLNSIYTNTGAVIANADIKQNEDGLFEKVFGLTIGTTDKAEERQENLLYGMQKAREEYEKIPEDIAEIGKKAAETAAEVYENKGKAWEAGTDKAIATHIGEGLVNASSNPEIWKTATDTGMCSHLGGILVYTSVNPGKAADEIGGAVDGLLFETIRSGFNNDNLIYGIGQVFTGTMSDLALVYGGASLLGSSGKTVEMAGKSTKREIDFYIKPTGEVIPGTGYRYISSTGPLLPNIQKNMVVLGRDKPTYFSFDKFDIPSPSKLQVPHDASIRLDFDTLQIIDDIKIPYGRWGTENYLEPITKDYFIYGNGGATQAITNRSFKINNIIDLKIKILKEL